MTKIELALQDENPASALLALIQGRQITLKQAVCAWTQAKKNTPHVSLHDAIEKEHEARQFNRCRD